MAAALVQRVALVGFHHKNGPQVDFLFPAFVETPSTSTSTKESSWLPAAWEYLPFLALPDGSHNSDRDAIFFQLPDLEDPEKYVYCVACIQQMAARDLHQTDSSITRNTVLKSVVVMSSMPLYGLILEQLVPATAALFDQKDFSKTDILEEFYHSISASLAPIAAHPLEYLYHGFNLRMLIHRFRLNALVLFKLLLLEQKVILCSSGDDSLQDLCSFALSVVSCLPMEFANKVSLASKADTTSSPTSSDPNMVVKPPGRTTSTSSDDDTPDRSAVMRAACLPLHVFAEDRLFFPYGALQQIPIFLTSRSFFMAVTNLMLVMHPDLSTAVVDMSAAKPNIEFRDKGLSGLLTLSTADLRFISELMKVVQDSTPEGRSPEEEIDDFLGSNAWIRMQFEGYLLSLLSSVDFAIDHPQISADHLHDFNDSFVAYWRGNTKHYLAWAQERVHRKKGTALYALVTPSHPCHGSFKATDVTLKMSHMMNFSRETDQKVEKAKKIVGGAVASTKNGMKLALGSLRTNVSSFWRGFEPPKKT